MAVNHASKYESKIDERMKLQALTERAINREYDFNGVNTINIYSVPTVPMTDYTMSGSSRYGTPKELENELQTEVLKKDRSFTFTIDRRNYTDTLMTLEAGKALARQIDEVIIPEIDTYRLSVICSKAGKVETGAVIDKTNAYTSFLDGVTTLLENKVPLASCFAYISTSFYKAIRQDDGFIKASDMAQDMLAKGSVGMIEGIQLIYAPSVYLPEDVEFVITSAMATVGAEKLTEYKTHDNPPGINGWLVEGRIYYDAFVLNNKKNAIYVYKKTGEV